ncbi:MAG TPA: hypothetical protein VJJ98_00590 [Sedimentisphaerales bacterium]|nr:hypothetical protein [Sedimentisphaerales bacterium]
MISAVYDTIDLTALAISGIFVGSYLAVHLSFVVHIMNLKEIKTRAIYCIVSDELAGDKDYELVELIDFLYKKSKVLVLPAERRDIHTKVAIWSFLIISVVTIFYSPLKALPFVPDNKKYILSIYFMSLGIACSFLLYHYLYHRHYHALQKEYYERASKSTPSQLSVVRTPDKLHRASKK